MKISNALSGALRIYINYAFDNFSVTVTGFILQIFFFSLSLSPIKFD